MPVKLGYIHVVGVLKPYRRQRIGTALMYAAIRWLASRGVGAVELYVDSQNPTGAPRFFKKLGFRTIYKRLIFVRTLSNQRDEHQ